MKRVSAFLLALVMALSLFASVGGHATAEATETLVMHISSQAHTLAKWSATAGDMISDLAFLVFDPVLLMDEDGSIKPWLAEEYEMAEDGMSIRMKMREDVWFTNGSKFNA